jgi:Tfp pilus assembly PilM family ATPase/Tfp pilus assembly protein PilN
MLGSRNKYVALDYDRREVRLVAFEYSHRQPVILSMHTAAIPPGTDTADVAAFGAFLRELAEKLKLTGAGAFLLISRAQAVLKSLTLPGGSSQDDLAGMVGFQVKTELPFGADEAVIDFTPAAHWDRPGLAENPDGQTVLVAAVRLPLVTAMHQLCLEARLAPMRLGLRPYANLRSVYRCIQASPGEKVLLVNLTADGAEIDVLCDGSLEFSRVASLPAPEAQGAPAKSPECVNRAVAEVVRCLQSYNAMEQPGSLIGGCLVSGATGLEKPLVEALARQLGVKVELLDVGNGFSVQGGPELSGFSAALGLCAADADEPLPFDFFSPKRQLPPKNTRRRNMLAAAVAGAVVLGAIILATQAAIGARQTKLTALQEENKSLKETNKQLRVLAQRVTEIRTWEGGGFNWLDHLDHLSNTLPPADQLYLTKLGGADDKLLNLDGQSRTPLVVSLLNHDGYQANLKSNTPVNDPLGYNWKFQGQMLLDKAKPVLSTSQPAGRPSNEAAGRTASPAGPAGVKPAAPAAGPAAPNAPGGEGGGAVRPRRGGRP